VSVLSYFEGGIVSPLNVPIENNHAHDVIVRFAFKSRLEVTSRCITTVGDAPDIGLNCEVGTRFYEAAVGEGCDVSLIVLAETKRNTPPAAENQRIMRTGTEHG
jgi:hypothetical protein